MPEREVITLSNPCVLSQIWQVDERVMALIFRTAELFQNTQRRPVWIISGWRTREEQRRLHRIGRQAAPDELSTHRSCPATGVDISLGSTPPSDVIRAWGDLVELNGLRWGGGSPKDERGIPSDWPHVDAGRRAANPTMFR